MGDREREGEREPILWATCKEGPSYYSLLSMQLGTQSPSHTTLGCVGLKFMQHKSDFEPVVPVTEKAETGRLLEPRIQKPAWATHQDSISSGKNERAGGSVWWSSRLWRRGPLPSTAPHTKEMKEMRASDTPVSSEPGCFSVSIRHGFSVLY